MEGAMIRHRMDLMLRLVDTTTGEEVGESDIRFFRDGKPVTSMSKGGGIHVFTEIGREDFPMRIEVRDYEPHEISIVYEDPEKMPPFVDVFLIPSENMFRGGEVLTLSGRLPGLTEVEAVSLGRPVCNASAFDEKQRILTVFSPGRRVHMDYRHYALVHEQSATYESMVVEDEVSSNALRLKEPLKEEFSINSPVSRIVFGRVKGGRYLLRVRDTGNDLRYLIRYVYRGKEKFKEADFHALEEFSFSSKKKEPDKEPAGMEEQDPV